MDTNGHSSEKKEEVKCDEQIKSEESIDIYYEDIKREIKEEEIGEIATDLLKLNSPKVELSQQKQVKSEDEIDIYYGKSDVKEIREFGHDVSIHSPLDSFAFKTLKSEQTESNVGNSYMIEDGNTSFSGITSETQSILFLNKQYETKFKDEETFSTFSREEFSVKDSRVHENLGTGEYLCKNSFSQDSNVTIHQKTDTGERLYNCKICKKSYSKSSSLINHQRTHTGEKPFECQFCEKSFIRNSYLTVHQRTHTGEKPYNCEFCKKSFPQKNSLINHQRTHTGEKPFICKLCKKSFTRNSYLKNHQKSHTGEKPYNCGFCKKSFSQNNSLIIHQRTHTGEKPFTCKFCKKSFTRNSYLKNHQISHTEEEFV